jgi:2-dehydropantoate 2-reductase
MRIAIMGSGAVGGYFGGLLARAGQDVIFIARGEHLRAMRERGLRVESVHGDFTVAPVQAAADPAAVGPVDNVLFATKTWQIEDAARAMLPLIGPDTTVLPLHNGVDAAERTAAIIGAGHVLGGVCYVGSELVAPGFIRQVSQFRRVAAGELSGPVTPRVERIVAALRDAGAVAEAANDIQRVRWTKFAFIAPFSAVGAVSRVPAGEIVTNPETRSLTRQAVAEVEAVARARGVALDADVTSKTMAFIDNLNPIQLASMQRDMLEGRPSELESIVGIMARLGAELGVPVPVFDFCYAALLPQERRARQV